MADHTNVARAALRAYFEAPDGFRTVPPRVVEAVRAEVERDAPPPKHWEAAIAGVRGAIERGESISAADALDRILYAVGLAVLFRCSACGRVFAVDRGVPSAVCPRCGNPDTELCGVRR